MRWLYRVLLCILWPFFNLYHPTLVSGRENIPEGGALICANHTSLSDPVFVVVAFGLKYHIHPMAKADLLRMPVLGPLLKGAGIFGVERGKADLGAIKTAMSLLKKGNYVLMFPEGKRIKEGDDAEAKKGAAMLAVKMGVPVVPVYVPSKKRAFRPVRIIIGESYYMKAEGKRATSAEYAIFADELMEKIYSLGEGK